MSVPRLFAIIGTAKAGTSSLAEWLDAHPDFRRGYHKETRAFCDFASRSWSGPGIEGFVTDRVQTPDELGANYEGLEPHQWAIDGSTDYLWYPGAAERLAAYAEDHPLKLVCLVRDPISRAVSEYNHTLRAGLEGLSFGAALEAEPRRFDEGWQPLFYHRRRSTVSADIARFRDMFGANLLILDYADLADPQAVIDRVCAFVGVPSCAYQPQERNNQSFLPRNALARHVLENRAIRGAARALVPDQLRQGVRRALYTNARNLETVTEAEKGKLRDLLRDEIDACLADPDIPTENWREALN